MREPDWTAVDEHLSALLVPQDAALTSVQNANRDAGLPPIDVAPNQGKLLMLLARISGARSVLEIGTLGGYSTIWLARGLPPDGRVVTLEVDPRHAEVARANLARAGLADRVQVRLGPALETLVRLDEEGAGPFDLVFIDADKPSNPDYFSWALRLTKPGSLIVVDNVVRGGAIADESSTDDAVQGSRRVLELIGAEPSVTGTVLQTVGVKGYDRFAFALLRDPAATR